jgi:2-polyprenyl-3-methyl-5-hydroxy-6-metoxy-1,4-benzoquinol methylase
MARATRWVTDTNEGHSEWYIERFRTMAREGVDLAGEARLVDAMVERNARILDAGCGPGRVGAELHARGHEVVGVDADPTLIVAAEEDHPGPRWLVADLAELDLASQGEAEPFDAAVLAGNVIAFLAPGTEEDVLRRVGAHVKPEGFVVAGFHVDRVPLEDFDRDIEKVGLRIEHRFATWDLKAWHDEADFAVTVLRHADGGGERQP